MDIFNSAVTRIFDWLLWPFGKLSPVWGLLFISILSGVVFLILYGRFSNQAGIRAIKRKIGASMLEAVLYRHDLKVCLRAQGRMFLYAFVYVAYALPPLLVLMVPCLIILAQLNLRYNVRPLEVGERAIVRVKLEKPELINSITLTHSQGLSSTPRLRIPESQEILWRLEPTKRGEHFITVKIEDSSLQYTKPIYSRQIAARISTQKLKSPWMALLYPGDKTLEPSSPISEISITYPDSHLELLGIPMHWLLIFLLVSIISGLLVSKPLGISV